jgi:glycosyltransferase involved in cell wall biosynthesis
MRLAVVSHPCVTPINQDFFARVQSRTGWEVSIILPRRWKTEYGRRRAERWPAFRGDLVPLPVALGGNIPLHLYLTRMRRLLKGVGPDVVYVHNEPYAAATFQVVRAARALDGVAIGFYSAQNLNKCYRWPVSRWESWVHDHADFALPVSTEVEKVLQAKGYGGRVDVLPLSVDTQRFHPRVENGQIEARPFTAGYVGRIAAEKGIDTFLEALALPESGDARAVVVGDGPARNALSARAREIGLGQRITWRGYVPHDAVADAYRDLDVLVVPSRTVSTWKEQFGRVVIEALACGVPVIASDSGELPALIGQTGGGWTFPEGQSMALARVLRHVGDNSAEVEDRGVSGRRAVERLFGADAVADRFAATVASVGSSR